MRAQHDLFGLAQVDEDRVEAATGGVPVGDVERLEVVPGGLDFGPLCDREAHRDEHILESITCLRHKMEVAAALLRKRLGQVKPLCLELLDSPGQLELSPPRRECGLNLASSLVERFAGIGTLSGVQRSQVLLGQVDRGLLAQKLALQCPSAARSDVALAAAAAAVTSSL